MADDRIIIELFLQDKRIKGQLERFEKQGASSSRRLGNSFQKNFIGRIGSGLGSLVSSLRGQLLALGAAFASIQGIRDQLLNLALLNVV